MADPRFNVGFGTPFAEQIDFLRRKLNLPTDRWDDIQGAAHDRAFIVAGAAQADLLQDLREAVAGVAESGEGLGGFTKRFKAVVAKNGWTGWTGEGSAAGTAWRAKVIYQTNMATSYAAGRWRQLTSPDALALRPFWKYVHADGQLHPRPLHQAWNGLTLRHDHPFWRSHWPPNGWGCRCEAHPVKAPAAGAPTEPPPGWDAVDQATGAPVGIDRGFGHAPGANAATPLQSLVDQKLLSLDAPIGAAMWQHLKPALGMEREQQWWEKLDEWLTSGKPVGRRAVVGTLDLQTLDWLAQNTSEPPASAVIEVDDGLVLGVKQQRHIKAQDGLLPEDWRALPRLLDQPDNILRDTRSGKLLYVTDGIGPTKLAVEFRPSRLRGEPNAVVSAFRTAAADVAGMVKGKVWEVLR